LHAVDCLILAELRLYRRVAHRRTVSHLNDARGKFRRAVDRQRQCHAVGGHIHEAIGTLRASVGELRGGGERRTNERERMAQILDTPRVHLTAERARRVPVRRDVKGDVAVETLDDAFAADALVIRILRDPNGLEARATVRQVVHPFVVTDLPGVRLESQLVVPQRLAHVQIVAAALNHERPHRKDAVASAERRRGVGNDLLFRRLRLQSGAQRQRRNKQQRTKRSARHDSLQKVRFA
jgi:hypothetical protein